MTSSILFSLNKGYDMKKFLVIIFFIFLVSQHSYAQDIWKKLNSQVYINLHSKFTQEDAKIAWFKIISNKKLNGDYKTIKIKCYCNEKVLHVLEVKKYKNNQLIEDEINTHNVGCDYSGLVNGKTYYKALCK